MDVILHIDKTNNIIYVCVVTYKYNRQIIMSKILENRLMQNEFESKENEALLNLLIAAYYLRSKLDAVCGEFGTTISQYNVLRILKGVYPDGYPRCEIIKRMIEPAPDVTRLIDKLINERLVERFQSNEDRRLSIARITQKGLDILDSIYPEIKKFDLTLSNKLTSKEILELSLICEKIYDEKK